MSQVVINFDFPKDLAVANWEQLFMDAPKPDDLDESERVSVNYTLDATQLPGILEGLRGVSKRLSAIMSAAQSSENVKVSVDEDGMIGLIHMLNSIQLESAITQRHLLNCLHRARNP